MRPGGYTTSCCLGSTSPRTRPSATAAPFPPRTAAPREGRAPRRRACRARRCGPTPTPPSRRPRSPAASGPPRVRAGLRRAVRTAPAGSTSAGSAAPPRCSCWRRCLRWASGGGAGARSPPLRARSLRPPPTACATYDVAWRAPRRPPTSCSEGLCAAGGLLRFTTRGGSVPAIRLLSRKHGESGSS